MRSLWRFEIEVEVDDEVLAEHDGSKAPPPNDPGEWWGGDLSTALSDGFAEIVHQELRGEKAVD